jgi:hypothetical protein
VNAPLLVNAPPGANGAIGDTLQFTVTGRPLARSISTRSICLSERCFCRTQMARVPSAGFPTDGDVGRKVVRFAGAAEAHRDTAVNRDPGRQGEPPATGERWRPIPGLPRRPGHVRRLGLDGSGRRSPCLLMVVRRWTLC